MRCGILYHLCNLENVKNTHGGVLNPATLLKVRLLHGCLSSFLNCTDGNKSRNASHITSIVRQNSCCSATVFIAINRKVKGTEEG